MAFWSDHWYMNCTVSQALAPQGVSLLWRFTCHSLTHPLPWSHAAVALSMKPTLILLSTTAPSWWVRIGEHSSLPECCELVYVAQGHPSLPDPLAQHPCQQGIIHQSYLCTSEGKPQGRKFAFWRGGFKVLWHLLRGKCPSKPLDPRSHFFFSFSFFPEMNFIINTPSSPDAMVSLTANPLLHRGTRDHRPDGFLIL